MAREYGVRNADGSVTVWVDPENGQPHYPVRTESWETNQGTGSPTTTDTSNTDVFDYYNHLLQIQAGQLKESQRASMASLAEQQRANMAQEAIQRAQQAYLYERMRQLEIEEMKRLDERERHRLAVEAAVQKAQLTGWLTQGDMAVFATVEGQLHSLGDLIGGHPQGTMAAETGSQAMQMAAATTVPGQMGVPTEQMPTAQGFGAGQMGAGAFPQQPTAQPQVQAQPRQQATAPTPFGGWTGQTISQNPLSKLAWG